MKMKMYMNIKKGEAFEDMLLEKLEQFEGYEFSSKKSDIYEGTDFYYHRLPVDVTLNRNKRFVVYSNETIDLPACSIKVGVRFGNGRKLFKEPVMVLLFLPKVGLYSLVASDVNEDVLEQATDIFWALIDELKEVMSNEDQKLEEIYN